MMPLLLLGHDWTANERAETRRLEKFCEASNDWILECSHTDAGDPWCVVYDERHQRIVVHIARLERRLVVVMPRAQRVAYTTSMTAAVEMALNELRSHGPVLADTSSVEDDDTGPRGSARRTRMAADLAWLLGFVACWYGAAGRGPRTTSGQARAYSAARDDSDSDSPYWPALSANNSSAL
jgi:hypothetical protein